MVSKVTAIALVAIIAVPILVGYGLNFNTGTETVYEPAGDVTNVTPLLTNSVEYTYVTADLLSLNSDNFHIDYRYTNPNRWGIGDPFIPLYKSYSSSYSGMYYYSATYTNSMPSAVNLSTISEMWMTIDYDNVPLTNLTGVSLTVVNGYGPQTISKVLAYHYSKTDDKLYYVYLNTPNVQTSALAGVTSISFSSGTDYAGTIYTEWRNTTDTSQSVSSAGKYVDISGGFRLAPVLHRFAPGAETTPTILRPVLSTPTAANTVLMTVDLDSVTASDYTWVIEPYAEELSTTFPLAGERIVLKKTTSGGDVTWNFSRYAAAPYGTNPPSYSEDLMYDPAGHNVYQLELTPNKATMYYVGGWPNLLGYANAYRTWETETEIGSDIVKIGFTAYDSTDYVESPVMRVDYAKVRATETKYTLDMTYTPSNIKPVDPATTIDNIVRYGSSIDFGGINFPVSNGDIMLGTHRTALNGMTFSTIRNSLGTYDNEINGAWVSTTAIPSTITFNGTWGFNVTTQTMQSSIVDVNEWQPGGFAWDGVGFDFYLVGLIAAIGAFIMLAMYGRKSGAKVGGLMIVCGGAAFMFLLLM